MSSYLVNCDGLCEPTNPNGYACWAYVVRLDGQQIHAAGGCVGHGTGMTNNIAEYHSLLHGLAWLYKNGIEGARVEMDSMLVVKQVSGEYRCNSEKLMPLLARSRKAVELTKPQLVWVPREQNEIADLYSRRAYDVARGARVYA